MSQTNLDFSERANWGKNKFNNTFPVSLACYMGNKGLEPIYLQLDERLQVIQSSIKVANVFGLKELSENLRFNFESDYIPYARLVTGTIPRIDLVTVDTSLSQPIAALEIKLTALPDNSTFRATEDKYSCEIVIRPDTVVYLSLSIAHIYFEERELLFNMLEPTCAKIQNWSDEAEVAKQLPTLISALNHLFLNKLAAQSPVLIQPIWKTIEQTTILAENCLDLFVWSDLALTRLFFDTLSRKITTRISRQGRAVVWMAKMLYDFAERGKFTPRQITDQLVYGTRNDKAFSVAGKLTYPYLKGDFLTKPRVSKGAVREIILGDGQKLLSPERRLDAAIMNTPGLFSRDEK